MVKKLYKHEFIALLKWILPANLFCLVIAAFIRLTDHLYQNTYDGELLEVMGSLLLFAFVIATIGVIVSTGWIVVARFYKHLLCQEGYLTFTIPVSPTSHLLCKLICGCLVIIFTVIVSNVSIGICLSGVEFFDKETVDMLLWLFDIDSTELKEVKAAFAVTVVISCICIIVGLMQAMLMVYASMCMGHLAKKNRVFKSVLSYFLLSTAMNLVVQIGNMIFMYAFEGGTSVDSSADVNQGGVVAILGVVDVAIVLLTLRFVAFDIVFFLIARYILNNKLNLE